MIFVPLLLLASATVALPQTPTSTQPSPPRPSAPKAPRLGPRLDENGWPVAVPRATGDEVDPQRTLRRPAQPKAATTAAVDTVAAPAAIRGRSAQEQPVLASGLEAGSPLLAIYGHVGSVETARGLAGLTAWWRLTIHGAQGEPIGIREITHVADLAFAERDRLEFADGRVYGRSGASVFAERQGMPWPTLTESAGHELALLGLHLRLPWVFADGIEYVVMAREVVARGAERLLRIRLKRRPAMDTIGPELEPAPTDQFELWCDEATGRPREFVHTLAISGQTRRVLLEDWQDVGGVQMPHRRVYVDESRRQTTVLELLRVEVGTQVTDRDFRLR
ncbi:MAG: hypothetical protein IPK26_15405 [Planctomycetes bacterium]|nr:hypothetical protein [Planctomycetota bacterium]